MIEVYIWQMPGGNPVVLPYFPAPSLPSGWNPCDVSWGVAGTFPNQSWARTPATGAGPLQDSACYHNLIMPGGLSDEAMANQVVYVPPETPWGFRITRNMMVSPSPGDFLPPSPTIGGSSVALVPPGMHSAPTGWNGLSRPVLAGTVDLVTGLPLHQYTDLELPFGGANFRLTRTRSGQTPEHRNIGPYTASNVVRFDDQWWDWLGHGWMAGENPLLLIDATMGDTIGNNPPTTWLILDAHHSIPFQLLEGTGINGGVGAARYEAPPRFRARLEHNGVRGEIQVPMGQQT